MRRPLLVPVLLVLMVALGGCFPLGGGTTDPMNDASRFCQAQIAPKFDNPDTVVWGQYEGGPNADGTGYDFTTPATAKDGSGRSESYVVLCTVSGKRPDFTLANYSITDTGPAE